MALRHSNCSPGEGRRAGGQRRRAPRHLFRQLRRTPSPLCARRLIDQQQTDPSVVHSGTNQLIVRYHVSACGGRSVQGALVYATAVPFNQLSIPPEATTDSDGFAELDFRMLVGFPVSSTR